MHTELELDVWISPLTDSCCTLILSVLCAHSAQHIHAIIVFVDFTCKISDLVKNRVRFSCGNNSACEWLRGWWFDILYISTYESDFVLHLFFVTHLFFLRRIISGISKPCSFGIEKGLPEQTKSLLSDCWLLLVLVWKDYQGLVSLEHTFTLAFLFLCNDDFLSNLYTFFKSH